MVEDVLTVGCWTLQHFYTCTVSRHFRGSMMDLWLFVKDTHWKTRGEINVEWRGLLEGGDEKSQCLLNCHKTKIKIKQRSPFSEQKLNCSPLLWPCYRPLTGSRIGSQLDLLTCPHFSNAQLLLTCHMGPSDTQWPSTWACTQHLKYPLSNHRWQAGFTSCNYKLYVFTVEEYQSFFNHHSVPSSFSYNRVKGLLGSDSATVE